MRVRCYQLEVLLLLLNIITALCEEKSSLTFVIDNTKSMWNDLSQVKENADAITRIVFEEKASQIKNMVLITFNDPLAQLEIDTENRDVFKRQINNVSIHNKYGNWDCEEPSMNGALLGLQKSLPGSFIYVFTDASAKDYWKSREIKNLCQKKQSQIIFILTGHCNSRREIGFQVYYDIATACSGLAFYVNKRDVNQVLLTIQETIRGSKSMITAVKAQPFIFKDIPFVIDDETEYAIVTVSGTHVTLSIKGPKAEQEHIMWLDNAKIIKLKNPTPGNYVATVRGNTETSIYVAGRTDFLFKHGFSVLEPKSMNDTTPQPIHKSLNHLSIAVSDPKHSVRITSAQILDMNENVIKTLPLSRMDGDFYVTPAFVIPSKSFRVAVIGMAISTGKEIRRLNKIPITLPDPPKHVPTPQKPIVTISEGSVTETEFNKTVKLTCKATAYPRPQFMWKNSHGTTLISQSSTLELPYEYISYVTIRNPLERDTYSCYAINNRGSDSKKIELIIKKSFEVQSAIKGNTEFQYGQKATLRCDIRTTEPMHIYWSYEDEKTRLKKQLTSSDQYKISEDGKELTINRMDLDTAGKYSCKASLDKDPNQFVIYNTQVTVGGLTLPKITSSSSNIYKSVQGKDAVLRIPCTVSGLPKPVIVWKVNGVIISPSAKYAIEDGVLVIKNPTVSDSQTYRCEATNDAGSVYATFQASVLQVPKVSGEKTKTAILGSTVDIECTVGSGVPKPTISWQFMAKDDSKSYLLSTSDNVLRIKSFNERHAGRYKCVAHNVVGDAEHVTTLSVQEPPKIISSSSVTYKSVEGKDGVLKIPCATSGLVKPVITWKVNGVTISQNEKYSIEDGVLVIKNPTVSDSQTYRCEATNDAGSVYATFQASVLQSPKVSGENSKMVISGSSVNILCSVVEGVPKPIISWQFMAKDDSKYAPLSGSDNVLRITSVDEKHAGRYKCVAHNAVGDAEHVTTLTVQEPPKIISNSSVTYKSVEGKDGVLKIPCATSGLVKPVITWKVNGVTISPNEKYSIEDGVLVIKNPTVSDSQTYRCEATNDAGSVYATFQASVLQSPKVSGENSKMVISGSSVNILCSVVEGVPKPKISWQFMAKDDSKYAPLSGSDNVLRITSVDEKHAGRYKCVAHNAVGDAEHVTTLTVQEPPKIISNSSVTYKSVEGKDGVLKIPCATSGLVKPVITWKVNGVTISPNEKYSIEDGVLVIKNPTVSDSQTYRCEATNDAGSVYATFQASVLQSPKVSGENSKMVISGLSVNILCSIVEGVPKPIISWQFMAKDDSKYAPLPGSDNVLRITSVDEKHAGRYKCVAHNAVGDAEHVTTLTVQEPPKIISSSSVTYKSVEGKDGVLKIPCATSGLVKPVITWKVNGVTISPNEKYSIENGVLVIKNPTVSDSQTYRCEATNDAGSVYATFQASVLQSPKVSGENSKVVISGLSVNILCSIVEGVPKPIISWQFMAKDDSKYAPLSGSDNVLRITSVDEKHAGRYKCVAHNTVGDAEHVTTLTVQEPPKIISSSSVTYKSVEGKDGVLKIPCATSGLVKPVITWKVNGVTISPNEKYSIEDGVLVIKNPTVSDSQTYRCEATNDAGSVYATFQASVLQSPKVSGENSKMVISGSSVNILCSVVKGVPKPIISWQFMAKDDSKYAPLSGSDNVLRITSVDEKHAGRYKCVAHNAVGDAEHVTTLIVQVPPTIISSSSVTYKGVEGKDDVLKIPCTASGLPKPVITWKVNGVPISQNAKYSIEDGVLVIKNPTVSDSQTYRCEATNDAGSVYATFQASVQQIPNLLGGETKTAISGLSVNIECNVGSGVPRPTISWQFMAKDDSKYAPLSGSDSVLRITSVDEKHAGRYKCVAHNAVGDAEHVTTLTVQVPPKVISSFSVVYKSVEGKDAVMKIPCATSGLPKPVITWKVNGVTISQNEKYAIEDGVLIIKNPQVSDSQTYRCEATNDAGSVFATFQASVLQVPTLPGDDTKTAVQGTSVYLECNVEHGVPWPTISWQFMAKDDSKYTPLSRSDNVLRITRVDEKHAGRYKCVAHNAVGDAEHVTTLTVQVPPKIQSGSSKVYKSVEGKDAVLKIPCPASGSPKPVITWKVNGETISQSDKYYMEDGVLVIKNPTVSDSQTYTCEATNDAGSVFATFQANVLQTPKALDTATRHTKAKEGSAINIECKVGYGIPKPTISWQFMANDDSKFVPLPEYDNVLSIWNVSEEHAGRYKCVAHNAVGEAEHITTLAVQVPPKITTSSSVIYKSVEGKDAVLKIPCTTSGMPKPVITWKVNGVTISQGEKYAIEDGVLVIKNPTVSDSQTYTCEATNDAGSVYATFQASVLQVPKLSGETTKTAKKGSSVYIKCTAGNGVPKPTISWQFMGKDDSKYAPLTGSDSVLRITSVDEKHAGRYKCVAHNVVGDAEHVTTLTVQVPPKITSSSSVIYKSVEGKDAVLKIPCPASGLPKPVITWKVKGVTISQNEKYAIEDGVLVIKNPQVSDSQAYTCEATNDAGSVYATFQASVLQTPKALDTVTRHTKAKEGSAINIECNVGYGIPKPTISWQFMANDDSKFVPLPESDNVLSISNVSEKHAGRYKCVAHNVVGDAEHITTLAVQVPPKITTSSSVIYESVEGKDSILKIPCLASGLPKPVITWKVNGVTISQSEKYVIEDGVLVIQNLQVSDSQTYSCEATNDAGSVYATFQASVLQVPRVSGVTKKAVTEGSAINIECTIDAGVPKPTISWQFMAKDDSKYTPLSGSDSVLRITSVDEKHAGRYKCVAHNAVGDAEHVTTLTVQVPPKITSSSGNIFKSGEGKDTVIKIFCPATGLPKPVITWKVNGVTISQSKKYSIEEGVLVIKNPQVSDSQTYRCEATNDAGSVYAAFHVSVLQPTIIKGVNEMTVDDGDTVKIECNVVQGVSAQVITWQYKGKDDLEFAEIPITGNILELTNVDMEYAGLYKCIAHSDVGDAEHVTTLTVKFAPSITSDIAVPYKGLEGDIALRIPCDVIGVPKPEVQWTTGGTVIIPNERYTIVDGALIIKNPTKADSKLYVCEAMNELGLAKETFTAKVDTDLEDYGTVKDVHILEGVTKKLECGSDDPNQSVRWFMEGHDLKINKKYFVLENADAFMEGNYTCRVSDMSGAYTLTYAVVVGTSPQFIFEQEDTVFDWSGNEMDVLNCEVEARPPPDVVWTYNGKVLSDQHSSVLAVSGNWGHYTCNVSNVHGFVQKTFDVISTTCLISRKSMNGLTMPLILNEHSKWPALTSTVNFVKVAPGQPITLSCPSLKGEGNTFEKFPGKNQIMATCDKQDIFIVNGKSYQLSDLYCTHEVDTIVIRTKQKCLTKTSELIRVGYDVHGFLEAYEVCFDTSKNIPLYTRVVMSRSNRGQGVKHNWYKYSGIGDGKFDATYTCTDDTSSCCYRKSNRYKNRGIGDGTFDKACTCAVEKSTSCYSKTQLVNAGDVSDGPAQRSTYIESLNAVPYWRPSDKVKDPWESIESAIRSRLGRFSQFVVWTGIHKLQEKDGHIIPRYLWKVLRFDEVEAIAVVYINDESHSTSDILCKDVCEDVPWMRERNERTYCCDVDDFFNAFGLRGTSIEKSTGRSDWYRGLKGIIQY